jgi:hypothetical protein
MDIGCEIYRRIYHNMYRTMDVRVNAIQGSMTRATSIEPQRMRY